jgi:hypothetical protein
MATQFIAPLQRAWDRTRSILLQPFDLQIWLTIGFTAWLSRLWDGSIFGGDGALNFNTNSNDSEWGGLAGGVAEHVVDALENPLGFFMGLMLLVIFLVIGTALAWVSSRGAFMLMDNVAHRRGRVSEPWERLGRLGDSLFVWRVATQLLAGTLAFALAIPLLVVVLPMSHSGGLLAGLSLALVAPLGAIGLLLGLLITFVGFCTDQFVVPLMHRYDEGVLPAWERFLPLLRREPLAFVLMGLFYLVLAGAVGMTVAAAGAMTCCALFLVLSIPFIGTVVLLPVYMTARAFGPEFLGQFGEEYQTWPTVVLEEEDQRP